MTICAIHQPNFLPWLPYFDKIKKSDIFVFLDMVDYPKSGKSMGSWCNRVRIDMNGEKIWFSCPVIRENGPQAIQNVKINYDSLSVEKWLYTLKCAYGNNQNIPIINDILAGTINAKPHFLVDLNIEIIKRICSLLDIQTPLIRQSELKVDGNANNLLIKLCKAVQADTYLSGTGAIDYMDDEKFHHENINVVYQKAHYRKDLNEVKDYSIIHYLLTSNKNEWNNFNADA